MKGIIIVVVEGRWWVEYVFRTCPFTWWFMKMLCRCTGRSHRFRADFLCVGYCVGLVLALCWWVDIFGRSGMARSLMGGMRRVDSVGNAATRVLMSNVSNGAWLWWRHCLCGRWVP